MKFEFKGAMAYKNKFKTQVYISNLTDSFKIISPNDTKIWMGNYSVSLTNKSDFVIPPKSSRKFRFTAEATSFKFNRIIGTFTKIGTTGRITSIYDIRYFELKNQLLERRRDDLLLTNSVGPLNITLKNIEIENGFIEATVSVNYLGTDFLGINAKKIKLTTSNGEVLINDYQAGNSIFYNKSKKAITLKLYFKKTGGNQNAIEGDKITFDDVFTEYKVDSNTNPFQFILNKTGEGFGNPPKEEKPKDLEVIED